MSQDNEQNTSSNFELLEPAVNRFLANEIRADIFVNDPDNIGHYVTNLTPSKQVETLPHFMTRVSDTFDTNMGNMQSIFNEYIDAVVSRYRSLYIKGTWAPNTEYSVNDIIQAPDGSFWIVGIPYTSGATFEEDVQFGSIFLYGNRIEINQNYNVRVSWLAENDLAAGGILELRAFYVPGRHILFLSHKNKLCVPKQPDLAISGLYDYEEINESNISLSNRVKIYFDIERGDLIDVFVMSTTLETYLAQITDFYNQIVILEDSAKQYATDALAAFNSHLVSMGEGNARYAWHITEDIEAGGELILPAYYFPKKDVLFLWYKGSLCVPRKEGLFSTEFYQYDEIEIENEAASNKIKLLFPVFQGDLFDVAVISSGMDRKLELISGYEESAKASKEAAAGSATAAGQSALSASSSATTASTKASEASESAADALEAYNDAVTLVNNVISSSLNTNEKVLSAANGKLLSNISLSYNATSGELNLLGKTDPSSTSSAKFVLSTIALPLEQFLDTVEIVVDPTDPDQDLDAGTYFKFTFQTDAGVEKLYLNVTQLGIGGLSFDTAPTIGSDNLVKSGAIATALVSKGRMDCDIIEEELEAGAYITTPAYYVGKNNLLVFWNGVLCRKGATNQYLEVGTNNTVSTKIQIVPAIAPGVEFSFIVL